MKRVLQSCFDPLPRFMSMKSLAAVVTLLLVGTAISVFEYLESSRLPVRRPSAVSPLRERDNACQAAEKRGEWRSGADVSLPVECPRSACESASTSAQGSVWAAPGSDARCEVRAAPPSVFQPSAESLGG